MRIGLLLPSVFTSHTYGDGMIFAPLSLAIDLANGLVGKGHEVFFYASSDVQTQATIIGGNKVLLASATLEQSVTNKNDLSQKGKILNLIKRDFENDLTMRAYKDAADGKLDIMQSFHDFTAHYFDEVTQFPTVYTLHDPLPQSENTLPYERFKLFPHHKYISISFNQRKSILDLNFVANIYHGIDLLKYPFIENSSEELIFIGRLLAEKGVGMAIQLALDADKKLDIASSDDFIESTYYKETIAPYEKKGKISISGFFPNDEAKATFLGNGKAFLFPLQWEEPFGLVMIESMATGTPVIAFARGSVPEIVVDGETGFLVNPSDDDIRGDFLIKKTGIEGMKEAVERLYALSESDYTNMRHASRKRVESHFTAQRMVDDYEALYSSILSS